MKIACSVCGHVAEESDEQVHEAPELTNQDETDEGLCEKVLREIFGGPTIDRIIGESYA